MPGCFGRQQLFEYAVGKLDERTSHLVDEHLTTCATCLESLSTIDDNQDSAIVQIRSAPARLPCQDEPQFQRAVAAAKSLVPGAADIHLGDSASAFDWPADLAPDQTMASGEEATNRRAVPACGAGSAQRANLRTGEEVPNHPAVPAASQPAAESSAALPDMGEYELLEKLGEGGMGAVYKARQRKLKRIVALKLLPKERLANASARARFEREMEAVGAVDHTNFVRAMHAGEHEGAPYLVVEYVDGLDLSQIVTTVGPLGIAEACELVRQTAVGLQHAHEHGLVHRDIKPSNVMLTRDGTVKILDLGLALLQLSTPGGPEMTTAGSAMGTADYIAPEQVTDCHNVDIRADIYSLGCTLYKLLGGRAPFVGPKYKNDLTKMMAHVHDTPQPITLLRTDLPPALPAILERMMAREPAQRFATPAEVAAALEPFAAGADLTGLLNEAGSLLGRPMVDAPRSASSGKVSGSARLDTAAPAPLATGAQGREVGRRSDLAAGRKPRRFAPRHLLIAGGAAVGAMFVVFLAAQVIIRITNKDGQVTEIHVPPGAKVEIVEAEKAAAAEAGGTASTAPEKTAPGVGMSLPLALDVLDPAEVPAEERAKGLPRCTVAVLGKTSPQGKDLSVHWVAFAADGQMLAACSADKKVRLWRLTKGGFVEWAALDGPWAASFSPDNKIVGCGGTPIRLWDLSGPRPKDRGAIAVEAWAPGFFPDGLTIAAHSGNDVRLYDLSAPKPTEKAVLAGPRPVLSWALAPDGKTLATGSPDGSVRLWDLKGAEPKLCTFVLRHPGEVKGLAFSPDGKSLAAAYYKQRSGFHQDITLRMWDVAGAEPAARSDLCLWPIRHHWDPAGTKAWAWAADSKSVWTVGDEYLDQWFSSSDMRAWPLPTKLVNHLAIAPDGRHIATANQDGTVYILRLPPAKTAHPPLEEDWLRKVAAMPVEEQVEAVADELRKRNPDFDGQLPSRIENGKLIEVNPDGKRIFDATPLQVLRPESLNLGNNPVTDLSPLRDMKLKKLFICGSAVADLSPLQGMPLDELILTQARVSDLSPLKGMELTCLGCQGTLVSDLASIKDMKLTGWLAINMTAVSDLSPLKGMPLTGLSCQGTAITDLSPLRGMKLEGVDFTEGPVRDLSPLREMKTLKTINRKPAAEFWKEYDAQQPKEPTPAKGPALTGNEPTQSDKEADRRAAEWVLSLGGYGNMVTIRVGEQEKDISAAKDLPAGEWQLVKVELREKGTDAGLENFKGLTSLTGLMLCGPGVTDAGLARLNGLTNLQKLVLDGTQVGDAGLEHLKNLPNLQHLMLSGTRLGEDGLRHLKSVARLSLLVLSGLPVTDAGLVHLASLTNLENLDLSGTSVSDAGLKHLKSLTNLKFLGLDGTSIGDAGLEHLNGLTKLIYLNLRRTRVTDAALPILVNHGARLHLEDVRISAKGFADLKAALAGAYIDIQWSERNRTAAEAVLAVGGNVSIRPVGQKDDRPVKVVGELPAEYFQVSRVNLVDVPKIPDDLFGKLSALNDPEFDNLEVLDLSGQPIQDCRGLDGLSRLKELSLARTKVGDAGLEPLKSLKELRRLVLDGCPIGGPGLQHLKDLPNLTELRLSCPALSDLGVMAVGQMKTLERLSLADSSVSDEGLKHLHGLTNLKALVLSQTKVTAAGLAEVQQALPQCRVRAEPAAKSAERE